VYCIPKETGFPGFGLWIIIIFYFFIYDAVGCIRKDILVSTSYWEELGEIWT
jgi:hypothetical protein